MKRLKDVIKCSLIFFIVISASFLLPTLSKDSSPLNSEKIHNSGQILYSKQWLKNNNFSTQDNWYLTKGVQGDNSTVNGTISGGVANFKILGDNQTIEISDPLNDGSWQKFNNDIFLYPDTSTITADGIYVTHDYDESVNQARNYNSAHWRKNISLGLDMLKYDITSAFLNVTFNASVVASPGADPDGGIEVLGDATALNQFGIGDFINIYVLISDIDYKNPYTVALNKTTDLGEDSAGTTDVITDSPIYSYGEEVIITALNSAFDKDPQHSNFTITAGIDIYSEDNLPGIDIDTYDELIIKNITLTFTAQKKINQYTKVSWNQIGNILSGGSFQIVNASFNFKYKVSKTWLGSAPLSEINFYINNKSHPQGTFKLSSAPTSFQYAKPGGFDVTNLISTDVNISTSIEVFLKDSFELNETLIISIANVTLNISYIETFPDYNTDFRLFLNNQNKTSNPVIQVPINNPLNISFKYINQSKSHIAGATVQLEGKVPKTLEENFTFKQYDATINTSDLGIGISILTVVAQKNNYETKNIQIFVEVIERRTQLRLFVDGDLKNDNSTISAKFNEPINVTIYYRDNETSNHISGANVDLLGIGPLNEIGFQYSLTLNTTDLDKGINVFTIFAQLVNYTPQSLQFFIEIFDRETELLLFVNNEQKFESDIVQVQINEIINITVYYRDLLTQIYITGASVTLLGIESLSELNNKYNLTINTNNLNLGINILTILSQLTKFESLTIQFFIDVAERAPQFNLFINGENKTSDPVFTLPINSNLNITIKYFDNQTRFYISGAIIQLIGEGILNNFTENFVLNQYSVVLNTSDLKIGIKLFTIVAQATDYQDFTSDIRITITRISTIINTVTGESLLDAKSGQNFRLKLLLNNTDFGGIIKGATVSFIWEYGVGELTDLDNDGVYETILQNLKVGSHIITITAFAGDLYEFETYEIVLNVIAESKLNLTWIVIGLTGGIMGLVSVFISYQKHFKYPRIVRKVRKLRKNIRKGKKTKQLLMIKCHKMLL
ncbi:hypothetical protein LCGC14_1055930 [marine sediment metagenome]|uniref:Uncharacterized protein n=1 Tax=marine sediment metagenome TaxID=412755 RepID=A0A0F9MMJ2_9ZZZZ